MESKSMGRSNHAMVSVVLCPGPDLSMHVSSRGHVLLHSHARVQENLHSSPDYQLHYQSTTVANSVFIVRWFCVGHVAEFRTRGCGGDWRVKR